MPGLHLGVLGGVRGFTPVGEASAHAGAGGGLMPQTPSTGGAKSMSALSLGSPFGLHVAVTVLALGGLVFLYYSAPA